MSGKPPPNDESRPLSLCFDPASLRSVARYSAYHSSTDLLCRPLLRMMEPEFHVLVAWTEKRRQFFVGRRAQPKPQQMPLLVRLGMVLEVVSCVQHDVVVQKLDISRQKVHVQPEFLALSDLVDQLHRLDLRFGQPRHLGKPLCGVDVGATVHAEKLVVPHRESRFCVILLWPGRVLGGDI